MDRLEQLREIDQRLERLHQRLRDILRELDDCLRSMRALDVSGNGEPSGQLAEMMEQAVMNCGRASDMVGEIRDRIQSMLTSVEGVDSAWEQSADELIEEAETLLGGEEVQPFCWNCGAYLPHGAGFCPRCGARAGDKESSWTSSSDTSGPAPNTSEGHGGGTQFCPVCGRSVPAGQPFCLMCGHRMSSAAASAPGNYHAAASAPGNYHAAPSSGSGARPTAPGYTGSAYSSGHTGSSYSSGYSGPSPAQSYTPYGPSSPSPAKKRGGGLVGKIAGGLAGVFDRDKPAKKKEAGRRPDREKPAKADSDRKTAPPPEMTRVEFSAIAPKALIKGDYSILHIMMYEKAFREAVDRVIAEAGAPVGETRSGGMNVAMESSVRIRLDSPDVEIRDPEETRIWTGEYLDFTFAVAMPKDFAGHQVLFTASVYINDLIATKLRFTAKCVSAYEQKIAVAREDILSAFVSYASQDRSRVAAIIQGMNKARPDMDIFFDVESLRSGMDWEAALQGEIEKRDIFFLCWSLNARNSEWVQREWHYALTQKGIECIEPIPLDPPSDCPPPDELKQKHFNDRMLFVIKASE